MKLQAFRTIHPDLLPGLVNTALRNDCEDLDDLCATHDLDRDELERHLAGLGYRYAPETKQFRKAPPQG